ncbi:MAG TPA: cupin domain-containing protein [Saprospiraceae bacterium]|nr:cupin domain-containing protein [Saprospiraceae bacterium]
MKFTLPHTIESGLGETMVFKEIIKDPDSEKVIIEGRCKPTAGPAMHVHLKQDEALTVVKGKMGCQIPGQEPVYYTVGQTATFLRNVPHRFWNAGDDELVISSWVKPVKMIIFFSTVLYAAQKKTGSGRPEMFDASYLMTRYKHEYDMPELPFFVKKIIMPTTYILGRLLGKYKKYEDAPEPLK